MTKSKSMFWYVFAVMLIAVSATVIFAGCTKEPEKVAVTSITLNATTKTIMIDEEFEFVATVAPENATNKNVTFALEKVNEGDDVNAIASINNGKVKGLKAGVVRLVVTSDENKEVKATCEITISAPYATINNVATSYNTFDEAFDAANNGDTIHVYGKMPVSKTIEMNATTKSVNIKGETSSSAIYAAENFSTAIAKILLDIECVGSTDNYVTIENVVVDATSQVRAVYIANAYVALNNVEVKNGYRADTFGAGINLTGTSNVVMTNVKSTENKLNADITEQDQVKYFAKDLWVGSQVIATINGGCTFGSISKNANSFNTDDSKIIINGSASTIQNLFVENDVVNGGAVVEFRAGTITHLWLANSSNVVVEVTAETGKKYQAGKDPIDLPLEVGPTHGDIITGA